MPELPYWLHEADCRIEDFAEQLRRSIRAEDHPFAQRIESNTPIYDCAALRPALAKGGAREALMAEWGHALHDGPGLIVLRGAFAELAPLHAATRVFEALIEAQRAADAPAGDHFAKPGANDRIWNALEKLCLREPAVFARYYANDMLALAAEAWLGPGYQITSQINVVNPGGEAQSPHRDYHLGFQGATAAARYPVHVHRLSPLLTLQGAVAHVDMPAETGPTLYLPYSQRYAAGYLAWPRAEFRAHFEHHHVQLPLACGDAVFFNPALFHAAGHNRSASVRRMANLLQVSSPFGRAMESVDRARMSLALYPALQALRASGALAEAGCANAVAACAEGYAFPTNLDLDPPLGGLAPATPQASMLAALHEGLSPSAFAESVARQARRRLP